MKLYAVRVFVRHWDACCEFYRDSLRLTERFRDDDLGWAEYDLGGPCLGLQRVDTNDDDGAKLIGRFLGVSLRVDDIGATYTELQTRGVKFTSPPERQGWGGSLAHFVDPDGNELTLLG